MKLAGARVLITGGAGGIAIALSQFTGLSKLAASVLASGAIDRLCSMRGRTTCFS